MTTLPTGPPAHAGDALSARLDGELGAIDDGALDAHLDGCDACRAELAATADVRWALRSLPAVEAPPGFFARLLADGLPGEEQADAGPARLLPFRSRWAVVAQAAGAVAAGLLLVVGFGGYRGTDVVPEVNGAVEQHAATLSAVSAGLGGPNPIVSPAEVTPVTLPRRTDVPRPYTAPDELAGYRLVQAYHAPHGVHLLYEKGAFGLSVFEQEGDLDLDRLPRWGSQIEVDGHPAWRWEGGTAEGRVLVLDRGDLVVTLVGDESAEAVVAAAKALPGSPTVALGTRLRRACGDALEMLSPAG